MAGQPHTESHKVRVLACVAAGLRQLGHRRGLTLVRLSLVPLLVAAVIEYAGIGSYLSDVPNPLGATLRTCVEQIPSVICAVVWYRHCLAPEDSPRWSPWVWLRVHTFVAIIFIWFEAPWTSETLKELELHDPLVWRYFVPYALFSIWFNARLSLALPAAALGRAEALSTSWRRTSGHALRLFAVKVVATLLYMALCFPVLVAVLALDLPARAEKVSLTPLVVFFYAFSIAAHSEACRQIGAMEPQEGLDPMVVREPPEPWRWHHDRGFGVCYGPIPIVALALGGMVLFFSSFSWPVR